MRLFAKGFCMGLADLVPGVSGGTVAFMLGIYEELIGNLTRFDRQAISFLMRLQFRSFWRYVQGFFFLRLFGGMLLAAILCSRLFVFLLQHALFRPVLLSFFFIAILWSTVRLVIKVDWHLAEAGFFLLGLAIMSMLARFGSTQIAPTPVALFVCGALAVCAMLLPGISGSFVLLLLGLYQPVIEALAKAVSGRFAEGGPTLFFLGLGIVCGIAVSSRMINYLLRRHYSSLIAFLAGIMGASLSVIWPFYYLHINFWQFIIGL